MELTIPRSELSRLLLVTESVVQKKTTMPILSNVLLSATDGQFKIAASDLEVTAVSRAKARVQATGSTTVNGKVFADIVRELPEADVTLKLTEGERVEIRANSIKIKINGVSAEEYPSLPGMNLETHTTIPAKQILEMISQTMYAVSLDETRFTLGGVCFEVEERGKGKSAETTLRMVATDGHRLAMCTRPIAQSLFDGGNKKNAKVEAPVGGVIVPRKGLAELKKIVGENEDRELGIAIIEGFLVVESEGTRLSMRLIDGAFPDYHQVLPKQKGTTVVIDRQEFTQALRRVALLVTDKAKCVKLEIGKGSVRISSSSPELGEATEVLDCQYDGTPLSVGFNAKYLLDVASSQLESEKICMELHGELGPGKFYPEGDESTVGIVMPMRL